MSNPTRYTEVYANGLAGQIVQGDATLDLTSTSSTATLIPQGSFAARDGGDVVIPIAIYAYVTTTVAADQTAPIITVQDTGGNSTGATLTFTDGDAAGDLAKSEVADGAALTAVDLTSEGLRVKVTTAAADAGTAAGEAKVFVQYLLVK